MQKETIFSLLHAAIGGFGRLWMIIGEFNESYPPTMDGVGGLTRDYIHELRALGEECYGIVAGEKNAAEFDKANGETGILRGVMHVIPMISPYGFTTISKDVKKKIHSIPFDIVHAQAPFTYGRMAIKIARKRHIPSVMTFHSQFKKDIKRVVKSDFITNLVLKYVVHSFEMADYVWTVNDASVDILRSYGYKGDITVVRNFTNFSKRSPEEISVLRKEGREYLGIGDDESVALYVGQQRAEKNIDFLLSAFKILKDKGFRFRYVAVGTGPDMEIYKARLAEYGMSDMVIFTGKITDRSLLEKIYAASDLFTFPSAYDTSPLTLVEAAAVALPSLLIEGTPCTERTTDGVNSFHSPDDVNAYAALIEKILSDDELRKRIGAGAQRDIYRSRRDAVTEVRGRYQDIIADYKAKHSMGGGILTSRLSAHSS